MVHCHDGRPVQYERNDAYFQWRRIDRIREEYSDQELVDVLADTLDKIDAYRAQFDADDPNAFSLVEASQDMATEDAWEALSEWKTLKQRAALLDAARRDHPASGTGHIDAALLDRIVTRLLRSARFENVHTQPVYAPNAVVANYV